MGARRDDRRGTPRAIVGIGASAGGLTPLRELVRAIPARSGLAYVVIQHLAPDKKSHLVDLLANGDGKVHVEVSEAVDGVELQANHLYVIPPGCDLDLYGNRLRLIQRSGGNAGHLPVDHFFRALAREYRTCAIGVILSGSGSDGTLGAAEIRTQGGMVAVQDPQTAEFKGMPESAVRHKVADAVTSAAEIPAMVVAYSSQPGSLVHTREAAVPGATDPALQERLTEIVETVRSSTGYDFSHYKKSGLGRRVQRRMGLLGVTTADAYLRLLNHDEQEALSLVNDLLIGATSFFRDPEAWELFCREAVRPLVAAKKSGDAIRLWVPACATGEEAYSITAMVLRELDAAGKRCELVAFATDINDRALLQARVGRYPATAAADIPREYLGRFFHEEPDGDHLIADQRLRESIVFAKQNLLRDPPFSRLDLLLCRNLLIYLEPAVQARVIELFHFALEPDGILFLGSAESIGESGDLYQPISKKWRIYRRVGERRPGALHAQLDARVASSPGAIPTAEEPVAAPRDEIATLANELLLERFCPASVLINSGGDVLYFAGPTQDYLEQPKGTPTSGLLELARAELRGHLRSLIHQAFESGKPTATETTSGGHPPSIVKMQAEPIDAPQGDTKGLLLITFEPVRTASQEEVEAISEAPSESLIRQLEYELSITRSDLQSHIEQLKSVNEELQSANEELQISNEELETSREELQSVNEELTTVNAQLQEKLDELEESNEALANFQASTDVPTLFLDCKLQIRRYTPAITRLIALRATDVGRPLTDLSNEAVGQNLYDDIDQVIERLSPVEREVGIGEHWYMRRILPYRTANDVVDGVVITYTDITYLKEAQESLRRVQNTLEDRVRERTAELAAANRKLEIHREQLEGEVKRRTEELAAAKELAQHRAEHASEAAARSDAILKSMSDGVIVADPEGAILDMNPVALSQHEFDSLGEARQPLARYHDIFELYELDGTKLPSARWPLARALRGEKFASTVVEVHRFSSGRRWYGSFSGTPVYDAGGALIMAVLTIRDVTEMYRAETALLASEQRFHSAVDNYPSPLLIYDAERRIEFINPVGLKWLAMPEAEVLGHTDEELLPESVTGAYLPALLRALKRRELQTIETEVTHKGETRSVVITYVPLLDEQRRVKQILGIVQDMSDTVKAKHSIEKLNTDLRRRAGELQAANRELESFAYSVSHDLRAPLRAISSFSQILLEDYGGQLDTKAGDYLNRISGSAVKMADLIDDLLNLSRITRHHLSCEPLDFSSIVRAVMAELQGNGICPNSARFDIAENMTAFADRGLLRVALDNLLRNACKFTGKVETPEIEVGCIEREGETVYYVKDNGAGFDMAYVGNLFKPFQRLHEPTEFEGSGIGLAIVQRIIARHGGRIWASSEPEDGATFYFTL